MKKLLKKISIIYIIFVMLVINLFLVNKVFAFSVNEVGTPEVYSKGTCEKVLSFNGRPITTTYVVYNCNGTEYPAYCLNVNLPGVGEKGTYTVTNTGCITEVGLWRVLINGYPYETIEELGVANKEEAYTATKQAVYCYLYNRGTENYSGIGEAGERTLNALNKILENAKASQETKTSNIVEIKSESASWTQDSINKDYVSKIYSTKAVANIKDYTINIEGSLPEGAILTSIENEPKSTFSNNEKFKILIPIKSLQNKGEFKINVKTEMKTKPVLYGKSTIETNQDYALTTYMYEESFGNLKDTYSKNETTITILKQEKDTKKVLENAEFSILDENKKEVYTGLVTDKAGKISISELMPGKYYIKETKAPSGYVTYSELIEVNVKLNEIANITINNIKEQKQEEKNTIKDLEVEQEIEEKVEVEQEVVKEVQVQTVTQVKKLPKTGM